MKHKFIGNSLKLNTKALFPLFLFFFWRGGGMVVIISSADNLVQYFCFDLINFVVLKTVIYNNNNKN